MVPDRALGPRLMAIRPPTQFSGYIFLLARLTVVKMAREKLEQV